jgi:predicted HTH transcriptional regulator
MARRNNENVRESLLVEFGRMDERGQRKLLRLARDMNGEFLAEQIYAYLTDTYISTNCPIDTTRRELAELFGISVQRICIAIKDLVKRDKLQTLVHPESPNIRTLFRPIVRKSSSRTK